MIHICRTLLKQAGGRFKGAARKQLGEAEKYIHPQKQYADFVIRYFDTGLPEDLDKPDNTYQVNHLMHQRVLFAGDDLKAGKETWKKIAHT